jgi:hypothetical protein
MKAYLTVELNCLRLLTTNTVPRTPTVAIPAKSDGSGTTVVAIRLPEKLTGPEIPLATVLEDIPVNWVVKLPVVGIPFVFPATLNATEVPVAVGVIVVPPSRLVGLSRVKVNGPAGAPLNVARGTGGAKGDGIVLTVPDVTPVKMPVSGPVMFRLPVVTPVGVEKLKVPAVTWNMGPNALLPV